MSSLRLSRFALVALASVLALVTPALAGVLPVSPGAVDRLVEVTSACPAFFWSGADGAVAYEIAVLDLTDTENPVLVYSRRIEGAALAWAPSREECLAPGRVYAWLIRADVAGSGLGEWSAPRRFRVPGTPSIEEVDAALALLGRWRAAQPGGSAPVGVSVPPSPNALTTPMASERSTAIAEAPLATGVAAIRGEIPDTTGSAYGVFGITHSAAGAGVVARNDASGPDLILDGEAQGQADTRLTQGGIDRPSASNQSFDLGNSGAGALSLTVDGVAVSKEGHAHAGEAITSGIVAEARIASTLARDSEVMPIVLANDGEGSLINADYLDGWHASSIMNHNHLGQTWIGVDTGFGVELSDGDGNRPAITGTNTGYLGLGVKGVSTHANSGVGVWGETAGDGAGVYGTASSTYGFGGQFINYMGSAIWVWGQGSGREYAAVRVHANDYGGGIAAYLTNQSPVATVHARNTGGGEVLYLQNGGIDEFGSGGGDFIRAVNNPENDSQFRVLTDGEVRSDFGFYTPAADFAEMLPADSGLEPGDVLAIGEEGRLVRATVAFAPNVAGVYSTAPGFVGGHPVEGEAPADQVPLAVVGIVPVKVSAENGAIAPGDLLVASATPGHAMRAGVFAPNGTLLGKALEPHAAGLGKIRILVVLQ